MESIYNFLASPEGILVGWVLFSLGANVLIIWLLLDYKYDIENVYNHVDQIKAGRRMLRLFTFVWVILDVGLIIATIGRLP